VKPFLTLAFLLLCEALPAAVQIPPAKTDQAASEKTLQALLASEGRQPIDNEVLRGIAREYNTEILCLIAKQYADLATKARDAGDSAREKYYTDCALGYAVKASDSNPRNSLAHALLSYCYARSAKLEGPARKIRYARFVKSEAEKAIALDPRQDIALHVLGTWHYTVSRINPLLKEVAKSLPGILSRVLPACRVLQARPPHASGGARHDLCGHEPAEKSKAGTGQGRGAQAQGSHRPHAPERGPAGHFSQVTPSCLPNAPGHGTLSRESPV
jgi:hypothetical protein